MTLKKTWLDGTPFDYANWRQGQPNKGTDQIYARLFGVEDKEKYGTWDSVADFSYNYYPVCMMDAISGPINPPPPDATGHIYSVEAFAHGQTINSDPEIEVRRTMATLIANAPAVPTPNTEKKLAQSSQID